MIKIVAGSLPFANQVVFTATSEALGKLSELFAASDSAGIAAFFKEHANGVEFSAGENSEVNVDNRQENPFKISIAQSAYPAFSKFLSELAYEDEFSQQSLYKIGLLKEDTSKNDLIVRKVNLMSELKKDYDYDLELDRGCTWEAVLYHAPVEREKLLAAFQSIGEWSAAGKHDRNETVSVTFEDRDAVEGSAEESFQTFLSDEKANKVIAFFSSPFLTEYGEPRTDVQVWFEKGSTEIIVSGHSAFTGDYDADYANFRLFLQIIKTLTKLLSARTFAWKIWADQYPESLSHNLAKLEDADFLLSQYNAMRLHKLPESLKSQFMQELLAAK